ncbi:MAG: hypothetical protein NTX05_02240 [Fusobacteria bacterium]|nr:hypothetical protein [Fusobacteriota bacterium]
MFEEGYNRIIQEPDFQTLFENRYKNMEVSKIHNGYFSQDNKKRAKDTNGSTKDDDDTYELIMKDKERLLSLSEPLRFIFSHSALREGWDNPNVFQICTLNESSSEVKKRQEIGRGLRLAVYENGERSEGFQINYLTVMANESYEEFVSKLQKEFEEENGIKFGVLENHIFSTIYVPNGESGTFLGAEKSKALVEYLTSVGYVESNGKVSDKLKEDLVTGTVTLPQEYHEIKESIIHKLKTVADNLNIKRAEDKREIKLYAKLPASFKIETPLGNYNPDWALVYEERGEEKLYFIAETKGTLNSSELREVEKGKIHCGKKHFEALSNDIHFEQVGSLKSLVDRV